MWKCILMYVAVVAYFAQSEVSANPTAEEIDAAANATFMIITKANNSVVTKEEYKTYNNQADQNVDGCVELAEYKTASAEGDAIATKMHGYLANYTNCIVEAAVNQAYVIMDVNGDGKATQNEMRGFYEMLMQLLFESKK